MFAFCGFNVLLLCHWSTSVACRYNYKVWQVGKINSLDFHRSADILVTASEDDSVRLYDIANAKWVLLFIYYYHYIFMWPVEGWDYESLILKFVAFIVLDYYSMSFRLLKTTLHKKHGADRLCFSHHPSSFICSSRYNLDSTGGRCYVLK